MQRGTARTAAARLRREHGVMGGVPVLLSTEKPRCQLVSMVDMEEGNPLDYQVMTSSAEKAASACLRVNAADRHQGLLVLWCLPA